LNGREEFLLNVCTHWDSPFVTGLRRKGKGGA
jgi:hypothetical protein